MIMLRRGNARNEEKRALHCGGGGDNKKHNKNTTGWIGGWLIFFLKGIIRGWDWSQWFEPLCGWAPEGFPSRPPNQIK